MGSKRELNQRRVRRATQALVAVSVAATAVFVGAAARTTGTTGSAGDDTTAGTASDATSSFGSSYDTLLPSSSAPTNSFAVPSAVSGGS
jgi:hypothetical protein